MTIRVHGGNHHLGSVFIGTVEVLSTTDRTDLAVVETSLRENHIDHIVIGGKVWTGPVRIFVRRSKADQALGLVQELTHTATSY